MTTAKEFTEWYKELKSPSDRRYDGPEWRLPEENTPFGKLEFGIEEGRDPDYPSSYYLVVKVGDEYFKTEGRYDSWEGVDWDYCEWTKVEKVERVQTYWKDIK